MSVDVIVEDQQWKTVDLPHLAEKAVAATFAHLKLDPSAWEVTVLACDDHRISALNREFRDSPKPTNVLSWPSADRAATKDGETPDRPAGEPELGDIALAFETCQREAAEQRKPFEQHILHLIVHGILHLLGYDHVRKGDGDLMESTEIAILQLLGVPDPYTQPI